MKKWNLIDLLDLLATLWRCNSAATHSGLEAAQAACLSSLARDVHKESGLWDPLQLTVHQIAFTNLLQTSENSKI